MTLQALPSIFLSPDAVQTQTPKLMGRQSAGRGFMRALAGSSDPDQRLHLVHAGGAQQDALTREARDTGWVGPVVHHLASQPAQWPAGGLHYPAPMPTRMAWQRARRGQASLALTGVTHTISSDAVLRQFAEYVDGPFAAWDALICTSQSVRKVVHQIWELQCEQLAKRLGVPKVQPALPMTPVIPLGVHTEDFVPDAARRQRARTAWGATPDEVVLLFVGRLSFHAKANPLPMYLAAARAQAASRCKLRVVECGWFANDATERAFDEAATLAGVRVTHIDGRAPGAAQAAFAGADVFVSLSDNIQETFGLTPLEAMAAGLPVVASDWDGYRETVRHGVDGFLIPTHQPTAPEVLQAASEAYEDGRLNYDHYIAHAHLAVSVDIASCAHALQTLIEQPALRRQMGEAGRAQAQAVYDWRVVIGQYDALWQEQQARRLAAGAKPPERAPAYTHPLKLFDHYATHALSEHDGLWQDPAAQMGARELSMWAFARHALLPAEALWSARLALPKPGEPQVTLAQWASAQGWRLPQALAQAAFMHKIGWLRIAPHVGE